MDNIPLFIKNKNNKVWEQFTVDEVNEIIKSTYGIIVYQEQIMRIVRSYANLTNRQADMFRYAIAKKDLSRIKSNKELFFTKAKEANRSEEEIEKLYNWIENFAGYGFNKAHTVSYSYITYLLLYYKTYYPEAFFHALGTVNCSHTLLFLFLINKGMLSIGPGRYKAISANRSETMIFLIQLC